MVERSRNLQVLGARVPLCAYRLRCFTIPLSNNASIYVTARTRIVACVYRRPPWTDSVRLRLLVAPVSQSR